MPMQYVSFASLVVAFGLSLAANVYLLVYTRVLMERLTNPPGGRGYLVEQAARLARANSIDAARVLADAAAPGKVEPDYLNTDQTLTP